MRALQLYSKAFLLRKSVVKARVPIIFPKEKTVSKKKSENTKTTCNILLFTRELWIRPARHERPGEKMRKMPPNPCLVHSTKTKAMLSSKWIPYLKRHAPQSSRVKPDVAQCCCTLPANLFYAKSYPSSSAKKNFESTKLLPRRQSENTSTTCKFCATPGSSRAGWRDRGDREKLRRRPNLPSELHQTKLC